MSPEQLQQEFFAAALRERALATVMNLAARRNAAPATINRTLKYLDAGVALGGDAAAPWRHSKFQLLIALDRPDDLERDFAGVDSYGRDHGTVARKIAGTVAGRTRTTGRGNLAIRSG